MAVAMWSSSVALSGRWWYRALGRTPNWAATARAVTPLNPAFSSTTKAASTITGTLRLPPHCGLPI